MMKKPFYILLILTLSISACKNSSEKKVEEPKVQTFVDSLFCKNQLELITNDTIPVINLDLTESLDSCINQIQKSFDFNLCDRKIYYSIPYDLKTKKIQQTENSIFLKLRLYRHCDWYCGDGVRIIWILMNEKTDVLIENNIVKHENLNSIDSIIQYYYLHDEYPLYEKPKSSFIALMWDKGVSIDKLTDFFNVIINGYLSTIDEYSENKFHKTICELSNDELKIVKDSIPFEFELVFESELVEPPPPEPEIEIDEMIKNETDKE